LTRKLAGRSTSVIGAGALPGVLAWSGDPRLAAVGRTRVILIDVRLRSGTTTRQFQVFLSSADEVRDLRDLTDELVRTAVGSPLLRLGIPVRFDVDRWERSAPHRILPGATTNEEFVARAKHAHLVLCLLGDDLRPGTREELEAALAEPDVEISVVWCVDRNGPWPDTDAGRFLDGATNC
jgi:hypothetical protein